MMDINAAPLLHNLIVKSFSPDVKRSLSDLESRLMHLGFFEGQTIKVRRKTKLFKGPLLVEVRGRLVALSQFEASLVNVEIMK